MFRLFHTVSSRSFHRLYVHCQRCYRWKPIILKLVKEVAATVKVDVAKRRDNMNIVSYVHVKKLFVAEEEPQAEVHCVDDRMLVLPLDSSLYVSTLAADLGSRLQQKCCARIDGRSAEGCVYYDCGRIGRIRESPRAVVHP